MKKAPTNRAIDTRDPGVRTRGTERKDDQCANCGCNQEVKASTTQLRVEIDING